MFALVLVSCHDSCFDCCLVSSGDSRVVFLALYPFCFSLMPRLVSRVLPRVICISCFVFVLVLVSCPARLVSRSCHLAIRVSCLSLCIYFSFSLVSWFVTRVLAPRALCFSDPCFVRRLVSWNHSRVQSRILNLLYIRVNGTDLVFVLSNNYDSRDDSRLCSLVPCNAT